jgi:hypothetical protein
MLMGEILYIGKEKNVTPQTVTQAYLSITEFPTWNLIPKGFLSQLNTNSAAQFYSMIESI